MKAVIDTMANTFLHKKTKTLLETLGDVKEKKKLKYTLVYTVGKTKAKTIFDTLRIVRCLSTGKHACLNSTRCNG